MKCFLLFVTKWPIVAMQLQPKMWLWYLIALQTSTNSKVFITPNWMLGTVPTQKGQYTEVWHVHEMCSWRRWEELQEVGGVSRGFETQSSRAAPLLLHAQTGFINSTGPNIAPLIFLPRQQAKIPGVSLIFVVDHMPVGVVHLDALSNTSQHRGRNQGQRTNK